MHTLSRRLAIVHLITLGFVLAPPIPGPTHANEFPDPPQRKPDPMIQRRPLPEIRVFRAPNVVGQRLADARVALERAGLRAGRETAQPTREATPGTVVRQEPAAGTVLKPSDTINLWIATAPARPGRDDVGAPVGDGTSSRPGHEGPIVDRPRLAIVPDLVGRPAVEAPGRLERSRLRMGAQRGEESAAAPGTVVSQTPTGGSHALVGSPVSIVVATARKRGGGDVGAPPGDGKPPRPEHEGPIVDPPRLAIVPDLIGRPMFEAAARLEQSRLRLGTQREEESEATPGTVVDQTPGPGRRVPIHAPVSIVLATPVLVTVPELIGHPTSEARMLLERSRLTMGDQRHEESEAPDGTVVRQTVAPGERVRVGAAVGVVLAAPALVPVPAVAVAPAAAPTPSSTPSPPTPPPPPPGPAFTPTTPRPPREAAPPTPRPARALTPTPPAPPARADVPTTPARQPAPAVAVAPAPVPAPPPPSVSARSNGWRPVAWSVGSVLALAAAGGMLYRYRPRRTTAPSAATVPAFEFPPHWDTGTVRIEPAGALCSGPGLRLVSGIELGSPRLDSEHLVKSVFEEDARP